MNIFQLVFPEKNFRKYLQKKGFGVITLYYLPFLITVVPSKII